MIQTLLVLTIVAAAVFFVARRAWKTMHASRQPSSGCDGCGKG